MAQWYYTRNGQQAGPVDEAELSRLISSGQVSATDMVWKDGMPNWLTAASVPEFSGAAGGAAGAYGTSPQTYGQPQYGQPQYGQGQYDQGQYGQPVQPLNYGGYPGQATGQSHFGKSLASLLVSLLGLVVCGVICGAISIALSMSAMNGMKQSGNKSGKVLAIIGLVIGIIDIPAGIIAGIYMVSQRHGGF